MPDNISISIHGKCTPAEEGGQVTLGSVWNVLIKILQINVVKLSSSGTRNHPRPQPLVWSVTESGSMSVMGIAVTDWPTNMWMKW